MARASAARTSDLSLLTLSFGTREDPEQARAEVASAVAINRRAKCCLKPLAGSISASTASWAHPQMLATKPRLIERRGSQRPLLTLANMDNSVAELKIWLRCHGRLHWENDQRGLHHEVPCAGTTLVSEMKIEEAALPADLPRT